jgi:endonuclease YncB( thermonuclease family)
MRHLTRYFRQPRFRRRRKVAILWPLLVLLTALVAFLQLLTTDGGTADTGTATPTPTPTTTPPAFTHPNPQSLEQATVKKVIDGDTIDVLIAGKHQRVRYYGIDAPEEGEECYQEATERNRELVGTTVRLEADARDKDEHGRLLRYVFTNEGLSVDAALVSEGLAKAWREDGRYLSRLTILETDASQHGTGCLWK